MKVNRNDYNVLRKAFELACETLEDCAVNDETWEVYLLEEAQRKVDDELYLTKKQYMLLIEKIENLARVTGKHYKSFVYLDHEDEKVFVLICEDDRGNKHFDIISGSFVSFADQELRLGKEYQIPELKFSK